MNNYVSRWEAYTLGWLEAQSGKTRATTFAGDELRSWYFRGYDDFNAGLPNEAEKEAA